MRAKTIVLLFVALLVISQLANAQASKKVLTAVGTETCVTTDMGELSFEPSGNIKIRGMITVCDEHDFVGPAAPYVTGPGSPIAMNCNLNKEWAGQCWGTFGRPWQPDVTSWEGVWEGEFDFVTGAGGWKIMGHGRGPLLEGLMLEEDVVYPGGIDPPIIYAKVFNAKAGKK
jgi:hypothetical protein